MKSITLIPFIVLLLLISGTPYLSAHEAGPHGRQYVQQSSSPYDRITWMDVNRMREARERAWAPRVSQTIIREIDSGSGDSETVTVIETATISP